MKKITKSLIALALLFAGTMGVNAEKQYADLTKLETVQGTNATWDAENNTLTWVDRSNNMVSNFEFSGNLSSWEKIVVNISSLNNSIGVRIQIRANGKEKTKPFNGTGSIEVKLSDFGFDVGDLNNVEWVRMLGSGWYDGENHTINGDTPGSAVISEIYLECPDDPLAMPKENLRNAIANANGRAYGKTEATANALTTAIADGNAALAAEGATEESLTIAITAIENAIKGLKLKDGVVNFTRDMFHEWTGIDAESTITGAGGCDFNLNKALTNNGMLYGNASVLWNQYAKIVNAKSFIVIGSNGSGFGARTDRLEVGNGGGDGNGGALTTVNINIGENGVCVIDLSEKESFRINAIKGAGFVTEMLVEYKPIAVSVGEAGYSTFSSDQNTKVNGAKAYAAKLNGTTIELSEITEIPAGNGVIIEADADTYEFPVVNEAAAIENNDLKVSDGTATGDGASIYVLAKKDEKVGFYLLTSGETIPAGKAYLKVNAEGREFIGFAEDVTAIKNIETVKADGAIYNLAGQQVKKAQKGLYIINGKKVIK